MILPAVAFSISIVSLIWARYFFFVVRPNKGLTIARFYDATVSIQILVTYYNFLFAVPKPLGVQIAAMVSYFSATLLFLWSIRTAKKLDFAFSDSVGKLITNGPFKLVRHPFYTSYIVVWATNTILFNSIILWISFLALVVFYYRSAQKEENLILNSPFAEDYILMRKDVGMFLPKVTRWNHWRSEKSSENPK
jgi:protein-S-isoprenylcysteine O-methyltransferase Ste14